jgi:hypothetical protein
LDFGTMRHPNGRQFDRLGPSPAAREKDQLPERR